MTKTRAGLGIAFAFGIVIAVFVAVESRHFHNDINAPWALIFPKQDIEVATRMAELTKGGRFDDAIALGKSQPADASILQIIAATYFTRAMDDKNNSGQWAKLAADYSEKALQADPSDIANVFNTGVNYQIAGDYLDSGGCIYYAKAWEVFEGLVPRLQASSAEVQGRIVGLARFRKRNQEELSAIKSRLRSCPPENR